jgi:hypothetical protein
MKGEHKAGYKRPRTGEKRRTRQPFEIDKLSQETRDAILRARADGATWEETAERASKVAGRPLASSVVHRWYDVRVEQVQKEVMAQAERARGIAGMFAGKGFKDLPEATINALSSQVFTLMESKGGAEFEASLANLALVLSKLMAAQARTKQVDLARERLDTMAGKVKGLKAAVAKKKMTSAELASKLDEIYEIRGTA